eukprot:GHVT01015627.1.p1 GENE.GHVT01015627.1~~GHVT01015627.1.p1  ORF type:complete len:937 (+),score=246.35 GHVT01015627.1:220-2811(+)
MLCDVPSCLAVADEHHAGWQPSSPASGCLAAAEGPEPFAWSAPRHHARGPPRHRGCSALVRRAVVLWLLLVALGCYGPPTDHRVGVSSSRTCGAAPLVEIVFSAFSFSDVGIVFAAGSSLPAPLTFNTTEIVHFSPSLRPLAPSLLFVGPSMEAIGAVRLGLVAARAIKPTGADSAAETAARAHSPGNETELLIQSLKDEGHLDAVRYVNVERTYTFLNRVAQVQVDATIEITERAPQGGVGSIILMLPFFEAAQLGRLEVSSTSSPGFLKLRRLHEARDVVAAAGGDSAVPPAASACVPAAFLVDLPLNKLPGTFLDLRINYALGRPFLPFPASIPMAQQQRVAAAAPALWLSPYPVSKQRLSIKLPGGHDASVLSSPPRALGQAPYAAAPPTFLRPIAAEVLQSGWVTGGSPSASEAGGDGVDYPPIASDLGASWVSFLFPGNLASFVSVQRHIEVSHWGSAAVSELYKLHNEAASLKGSFSRLEYAKASGQVSEQPVPTDSDANHLLVGLSAALPRRAFGIEVFDKIGNISSTIVARRGQNALGQPTYTSLDFYPRFPVLGGWSTDWHLSYDLPIRTVLSVVPGTLSHVLNVTLASAYRATYAENLVTKVILPAGAYNVRVATPVPLDGLWLEHSYSWLDFVQPRTVVALHSHGFWLPDKELIRHKAQIFYDYSHSLSDMNKPLLIWILLLLPFLLFIFFSRLSIRISSPEEAAAFDAKEFKASITRQMVELFEDLVHANDDMMGAVEEAIHRCGAGVVFTKLSPTTSALLSPWRAQTQELLEQLRALVPGDGFCSRVVNATREFLDAAEALALKCLTTKRTVALTRVADRKRTSAGAAAEQVATPTNHRASSVASPGLS